MTKNLTLYENDPSVKLVTLKANGKAFCAGGDVISVSLINGAVMGGGAGLCMNTTFRIVTEKTVFAMPEASIGLYPDVGASYFLSRLPGYFGEYLGLTGTRLNGAEMAACGLATHFVPSKKLRLLENALQTVTTSDTSIIAAIIHKFTEIAHVKEDSPFRRYSYKALACFI
ncbi:putative 3-hydroxyisobutyryl-CoA hydrolase 3 [Senna tora]|uniref:3-hydroxyisobutyryl-CoA hydrolase n=1 Tax=Senna tora TaxID=362788 RepID=A0A834WDP0_9FABA|nr:putative 3-hydroxyisobutyryl-CoA hydrolase 3 [Senna tora]